MLGVILKEKEILNKLIKGENVKEIKPYSKMLILQKYHFLEGVTDKITLIEKTLESLSKVDPNYRRVNWEDSVTKSVDKMIKNSSRFKKEIKLNNINKLIVTTKEIKVINQAKTKNLRKLLFIMLLYGKINNIIMEREDGWFNLDIKNLFKEAKVVSIKNPVERMKILHQLLEEGLITKSIKTGSKSLKINYIDNDIDSEIAFEVTDLADCHAIYSYLIYIGEKWKKCEVCGKYIKEGKTKKIKYCSDCAKKINLEKTKMNLRENIKMKK